jgi:hypothetical protein
MIAHENCPLCAYGEALRLHGEAIKIACERPCRETHLNELHANHAVTLAKALLVEDFPAARVAKLQIDIVRRRIAVEQGLSPEDQALVAKAAMN